MPVLRSLTPDHRPNALVWLCNVMQSMIAWGCVCLFGLTGMLMEGSPPVTHSRPSAKCFVMQSLYFSVGACMPLWSKIGCLGGV